MKSCVGGFAIAVGALFASGVTRAGDDATAAAIAATREVSKQLETMQRAFATIPSIGNGGRGLFAQSEQIQIALFNLRQSIRNQASREDTAIAFLKLDGQVKSLLDDLQGIDNWDATVGYVARRLRAAESDLHFAVMGPDGKADRQAQVLYSQTLGLIARAEDLQSIIKYVYLEQDVLGGWMAAMKELRQAIDAFQRLQQKQAPAAELKSQIVVVGNAWGQLVRRFNAIPGQTYALMQTDAVHFDTVLSRVDRMLGVERTKAKLPVNLFE